MFWTRFYEICNDNQISPNAFAKEVKISSGVVTKWKKGSLPSTDALLKISNYFDISIDYLLTGQEKSSSSYLTENEQKIIDTFKNLTPTQQGEIIGRAKVMAEQNEELHIQKDVG